MSTRKTKLLIWLLTLSLVLACVPTFTTTVPTANPGAVNTFIAQTVIAASTQTSAALPSSTPTGTITPTPRTETPTPTATSTVIFVLSSPTPLVIPTFTSVGGGGGSSSSDFSCQVVSVSPSNGTGFNPRTDFDAVWRVRNNGQRTWDRNSVDFVYLSGDKFHKVSGYDLSKNVKSGETINLGVDMEAPRNDGNYTTRWTLRIGNNDFCTLSLTINVN